MFEKKIQIQNQNLVQMMNTVIDFCLYMFLINFYHFSFRILFI